MLAFGVVCIAAAIVGGGLKALGVEIPGISSLSRQIALACFGLILVVVVKWGPIRDFIFPDKVVTESKTFTLNPGESTNIPITLNRAGPVDVEIIEWSGSHELFFTILGASEVQTPQCSAQIGKSKVFERTVPVGPATVSAFNFGNNPQMTATIEISHPR
jgi:hypothetical protein